MNRNGESFSPEAGHAAKDGRAGEPLRPQPLQQRRLQRLMLPLVGLAEEDAHHHLFARQ